MENQLNFPLPLFPAKVGRRRVAHRQACSPAWVHTAQRKGHLFQICREEVPAETLSIGSGLLRSLVRGLDHSHTDYCKGLSSFLRPECLFSIPYSTPRHLLACYFAIFGQEWTVAFIALSEIQNLDTLSLSRADHLVCQPLGQNLCTHLATGLQPPTPAPSPLPLTSCGSLSSLSPALIISAPLKPGGSAGWPHAGRWEEDLSNCTYHSAALHRFLTQQPQALKSSNRTREKAHSLVLPSV